MVGSVRGASVREKNITILVGLELADPSDLSFDSFCAHRGRACRDLVSDFFGISGPKGTNGPVAHKGFLNTTICPETITEIIRFQFLRCKNYSEPAGSGPIPKNQI